MKNLILSLIVLLSISVNSIGQSTIEDNQMIAVVTKKYELIQTEFYTLDQQLLHASTDVFLMEEKVDVIDLQETLRQPSFTLKTPASQLLQISNGKETNSFYTQKIHNTAPSFRLMEKPTSSIPLKNVSIGSTSQILQKHLNNNATRNIISVSELPGAVPLAGFSFKL